MFHSKQFKLLGILRHPYGHTHPEDRAAVLVQSRGRHSSLEMSADAAQMTRQ